MTAKSSKAPDVSIVVPAYNAEAEIKRCLESLQKLSNRLDYEIIVVDNGSRDQTLNVINSFKKIKVLQETQKGASHARNAGWKAASAPFIAFIDSDCVAHPTWIENLLPELENNEKLAGVGGTVKMGSKESLISAYIDFRQYLSAEGAAIDDWFSPPFLLTCNAIYRRSVLEELNGFAELWPCEDADFSFRCQKAGYQILQFPEKGIVYHYHRTSLKQLMKMMVSYGSGGAEVFLLHRDMMEKKSWIEWSNYIRVIGGLIKYPLSFRNPSPLHKKRPLYDAISSACLIYGRWKTAIRKRAITL